MEKEFLFLKVASVLILASYIAYSTVRCVPVGHMGVVKILGEVQHEKTLKEGLHIVMPAVTDVISMSLKLNKFSEDTSASSKDLQVVTTVVSVQFSLSDVSNLLQRIGELHLITDIVLKPSIEESVKAVTAQYTAEQLITKRPEVKDKIVEAIKFFLDETLERKGLSKTSLQIANVAITDFDFSDEFNKSIETKVRAEQEALQAKNEKEKRITDAEAVAEQIRIESIAKANAILREAKALRTNPHLIEWKRMEKWDGVLPRVTGGAIPMFDVMERGKQ